jgi:hypothetical protein
VADRVAKRRLRYRPPVVRVKRVLTEGGAMPAEDQVLKDAYDYFANWDNDKHKFEALLAERVVWIEIDEDLGPRRYEGKTEVMGHVNHIKQALAQAEFVSVEPHGAFWQTTDNMKVQGHDQHSCVTDVTFDGGLIAQVRHCHGHGGGGAGGRP